MSFRNNRAAKDRSWEAEASEVNEHLKSCSVTGELYWTSEAYFISAQGLGDLVLQGWKEFEERHGACKPHNQVFSESTGALMVGKAPFRYRGRYVSPEGAEKLLKEYGRIRGWLQAAVGLSALARVIKKSQSVAGMNSPYTTVELPRLWEKYPSPGNLERKLWKVRRRAEEILSSFGGKLIPSWSDVANAVLATASVGKAAVIAAANTLDGAPRWQRYCFRKYKAARAFLVSVRSAAFPITEAADGIEARREVEPCYRKLGCAVYRIRVQDKHGRYSQQLLVRSSNGRTFHSLGWQDPRWALKEALAAWTRQDEAALEHADVLKYLTGEELGFCPIITRADSYASGNCHPGTEAWVRSQGWTNRQFIPGIWLASHLDDARVKRVALAARRRHLAVREPAFA